MSKSNPKGAPVPAGATKIEQLLILLRRPREADVQTFVMATGWRVHPVRAAISGQMRGRLVLLVMTSKVDGKTTYRLEG